MSENKQNDKKELDELLDSKSNVHAHDNMGLLYYIIQWMKVTISLILFTL